MAIQFYSGDIIDRPLHLNVLEKDSDEEFEAKYEITKCRNWILENEYKNVCLQFPDPLLHAAVKISKAIEAVVNIKIYILGDTSYGSCCVDHVAAQHVECDALIHFGKACLSPSDSLPVLYIFPKYPLDVAKFAHRCRNFLVKEKKKAVLLYDVGFFHLIATLRSELQNVLMSVLNMRGLSKAKLGRIYEHPDGDFVYIYLREPRDRTNLDCFVMSTTDAPFYSYGDESEEFHLEDISKVVKRKLYEIEKVKDANKIGILVATLSVFGYLGAIDRIKKLCAACGKKCYILSVGKPNVAKLANFPEIDVFVMISCPEMVIADKKDYYQPIVTMMELEMALNANQKWRGSASAEFADFLPGGSLFEEFGEARVESDVSLISNAIRSLSKEERVADSDAVAMKDPMIVSETIRDGLAGRSWRGLDPLAGNRRVEEVKMGRSGTPSGYTAPSSADRT